VWMRMTTGGVLDPVQSPSPRTPYSIQYDFLEK
jgi:hypothetical protein